MNSVVIMVAAVLTTLSCMFLFGGIVSRQKPLELPDPELQTVRKDA